MAGSSPAMTSQSIMEFDNSFEVPLPPADAWKVLLDIERIAPCMPGAELTEVLGDNRYKGKIAVRLGPVINATRCRMMVSAPSALITAAMFGNTRMASTRIRLAGGNNVSELGLVGVATMARVPVAAMA